MSVSMDIQDGCDRIAAIKKQVLAICCGKRWAGLMNMMTLSSVIGHMINSVCPTCAPLFHGPIVPRMGTPLTSCYIMWTRDSTLDNNGRQQRVKINDTFSPWMNLTRGVPQGGILSPLLFNIFINDIFYFVRHARLNIYVDDQQIYDSDKDTMTLHLRMENKLTTIVNWYAVNGLKANPEKFQAMILGKKT